MLNVLGASQTKPLNCICAINVKSAAIAAKNASAMIGTRTRNFARSCERLSMMAKNSQSALKHSPSSHLLRFFLLNVTAT